MAHPAPQWFAHGSPPRLGATGTRWAAVPSVAGPLFAAADARRTAGALLHASSIAGAAVRLAALAETSGASIPDR